MLQQGITIRRLFTAKETRLKEKAKRKRHLEVVETKDMPLQGFKG